MPREFSRTRRVAELLQRELADLIQYEIKDPRVSGMVTIADVKVSRDLAYATIYVTVLDEAPKKMETVSVLNKAAGFLRSALAQRVSLRTMPRLRFVYDTSVETGARLSQLIDQAIAGDDHKH
jgi:ribosome-binding factor A